MKPILFTLFIAFFGFQMTTAQGLLQGDANKKANKIIQKKSDNMAKELGLTKKQQSEIKNKLEAFYLKRQELLKQSDKMDSADKKDLKRRLAELKRVQIAEIRDILTGPQFAKYKKSLKNKTSTTRMKMKNEK